MNRQSLLVSLCLALAAWFSANPVSGKERKKKHPRQAVERKTAIPSVKALQATSLSEDQQMRFDALFLEARRCQLKRDNVAAYDLLEYCLRLKPDAAEVYFSLAPYLGSEGKDSLALDYMEKAAALDPDNHIYQEYVAYQYQANKDYDRAIAAYERLYDTHRDRTDVLADLFSLYEKNRDYDKMLHTLDRMEVAEGPEENIQMARMNTYERKGDKKKAWKILQELAEQHPTDLNYRVMMGNWLTQNKRPDEALAVFLEALAEEPDNISVQESLLDYYKENGPDSLAVALRNKMLFNPETTMKSRISLLQQAIIDSEQVPQDSTEVLQLIDRVQAVTPTDPQPMLLRVAYMSMKKMPRDSIETALMHVIDIAPDQAAARIQIIQRRWEVEDWTGIIELCKPAVLYNPEEMAFFYFMGMAYYQLDDMDNALDALQRGVAEINKDSNPEFVSDFYAIMGDILHQKGRIEEAFASYDECLKWKANNYSCLNNYAYYLSELNRDLPRAAMMSRKTIQAEPRNATYLDTYAWILYLQKEYAEAMIYIDQALACGDEESLGDVVLEHAGDIHYANQDMDGACKLWQQALEAGGDKDILENKIKKAK